MTEGRVVVFGTGALGSLFAARLARSGTTVTLAGTWREGLGVVAVRGIRVEDAQGAWTTPVATASLEAAPRADFALVLVKSHRTAAIAPVAAAALAPEGLVVTLQNGLGNREALESAAGRGRVGLGVVTLGATLLGPGHVRAAPGRVTLGSDGVTLLRMERLADLLGAAGFDTSLDTDIDRLVWRKLAVNCAINPLTALRRVPNGALLDSAEAHDTLVRAAREVGAVAAALGIVLGADPAELALDVARQTAANRSSMLQDLDRGARTEIDALCGAVVTEGRRLDVPTPVNEALWHEVRRSEAPSVAAPAERP